MQMHERRLREQCLREIRYGRVVDVVVVVFAEQVGPQTPAAPQHELMTQTCPGSQSVLTLHAGLLQGVVSSTQTPHVSSGVWYAPQPARTQPGAVPHVGSVHPGSVVVVVGGNVVVGVHVGVHCLEGGRLRSQHVCSVHTSPGLQSALLLQAWFAQP